MGALHRSITGEEAEVIRVTLERARIRPVAEAAVARVPSLTVVARCDCGCPSVDFEDETTAKGVVLAEALGESQSGGAVDVMVWGRHDAITALEITDLDAEEAPATSPATLPTLGSIRPWPTME